MIRSVLLALTLLLPRLALAEDAAILVEEHIRSTLEPSVSEAGTLRVTYSPQLQDAVLLKTFWMDASTGQFVSDVLTESGGERRIAGVAVAIARVPVPVRPMMPGEIVSRSDLAEIEIAARRVARFAVTDTDALVGMQVRRMLGEGRLVMAQSVMAPRLVERGQRVKIVLKGGGLSLSASGKALGDAALGEEVKVVNLSSNLSVVGIASADGIVEIVQ